MKNFVFFLFLILLSSLCMAYSTADFNKDLTVNLEDFSEFAYQWLQSPADLPDAIEPARTASYVIAANDSPEHIKARADYVCDGTDDNVQIQQAVNAMSSQGGVIYLAEGQYYVSGTITVDKPVFFRGAGVNWHYTGGLTRIYPVDGINGPVIDSTGSYYLGGIFDIGFDGYLMTTEVDSPMLLLRANGGDYHIERSGFYHIKFKKGIEASCHNVWIYDTCFEDIKHSSDDSFAVHISGGVRNRFINCHFRDNKNCIWFSGGGNENWIIGTDFHDTDRSVLRLGAPHGIIDASYFYRYDDALEGYPMIEVPNNISYWSITDCLIRPLSPSPLIKVADGNYMHGLTFNDNSIIWHELGPEAFFSGIFDFLMCRGGASNLKVLKPREGRSTLILNKLPICNSSSNLWKSTSQKVIVSLRRSASSTYT